MRAFRAALLSLLGLLLLITVASTVQATVAGTNSGSGAGAFQITAPRAILAGDSYEAFIRGTGYTINVDPVIPGCAACTGSPTSVAFQAPGGVPQITLTATSIDLTKTAITRIYASADWAVTLSPSTLTLNDGEAAKTVTLTVKNNGLSSAAGDAVLRVSDAAHVTGDCAVTGSGTLSALCSVPTLASGASKTFTFQLSYDHAGAGLLEAVARPGDTTGIQVLVSSVDPNLANNYVAGAISSVGKTDESGKAIKPAPLTLPSGKGNTVETEKNTEAATDSAPQQKPLTIALTAINGAQTKGSPLTLSYTVTNPSTTPRVGGVALTFGGALLTAAQGAYAPGANAGSFAITVPDKDGNFVATVADSVGSSSASTPLTVSAPHFSVHIVGPASLNAGQAGDYVVSFRNDGTSPGVGTANLAISGGTLTGGDGICETPCSATLGPGETKSGSITILAGAAGTPIIIGGSDGYGNAIDAFTTTVGAASTNLVFQAFSVSPANPHDGDSLSITITLINDGDVGITDSYVEIQLPTGIDAGDTSRSPCPIVGGSAHCALGAIPAHGTITRTFHMTARAGDYFVGGRAGSSVTDTSPGDNLRSLSISVAPNA